MTPVLAVVGGMVGGAVAFFLWLKAIDRQLKRAQGRQCWGE